MNDNADSGPLHDWIGQRRNAVSLLEQMVRQVAGTSCEDWNNRRTQFTIRARNRGIGVVQRKDVLWNVLQGNRYLLACVLGKTV